MEHGGLVRFKEWLDSDRSKEFLKQIETSWPHNKTPVLVFADWLEEQGNPAADTLRNALEGEDVFFLEGKETILSARDFFRPGVENVVDENYPSHEVSLSELYNFLKEADFFDEGKFVIERKIPDESGVERHISQTEYIVKIPTSKGDRELNEEEKSFLEIVYRKGF